VLDLECGGETELSIPLDADDEGELGLGGDEDGVLLLRGALCLDDIALGLDVLLVVLLGALEDGLALLLVGLRES
jgi:hypothetical protein